MRGEMIPVGARYEPPIADVIEVACAEFVRLKMSNRGSKRRGPKRNAREMLRSTCVTFCSRSAPRSVRNTVCVVRTSDGTRARVTAKVETYGYPWFATTAADRLMWYGSS